MTSIPTTQKAIFYEKTGGPEVLQYGDVPVEEVTGGEILIKNKFTGMNFIDVYFRSGVYKSDLPYIGGREASGVIASVGPDVKDWKVGDKVAYLSTKGGCFAQYTKVPPLSRLVKLPADADDELMKKWAGSLLQGLTALTFVNEAYKVQVGDNILVTAAAGGVGLLFDQLISKRGAHVFAIASTDEKLAKAKANGAEHLLNSSKLDNEQILAEILSATNGKGVQGSFDSIGKDTVELSLGALATKGTWVSMGNASGVVPPFSIARLASKNLKVCRPMLFGYISDDASYAHYTKELGDLLTSGDLHIELTSYPLKDYATATSAQEARKTTGKLVIEIPQ